MTIAVRPLTLTKLAIAIGIRLFEELSLDETIRDYIRFCEYLLTVTGNNIGLVHQSAKDYLLRKGPDPNPGLEYFRVKGEETNSEIARKCFKYLYCGALANGPVQLIAIGGNYADTSHLQAFPLLSYAVLY